MTDEESQYFDVALSFASEERDYVRRVADALQDHGLSVFFDEYQATRLWGDNLYQRLSEVYSERARYAVVFISSSYVERVWSGHELQAAQARALRENREYILPARFDDTEVPGVLATFAYVSLEGIAPEQLARMISEKIGRPWSAPQEKPLMFLLAGPSASGKDSILRDALPNLRRRGIRCAVCQKYSTRDLRPHENVSPMPYQNSLDKGTFDEWIKSGRLVVSYSKYGNRYAFLTSDLEDKVRRKVTSFAIYSDFSGFQEGMKEFSARGFEVVPVLVVASVGTCSTRMWRRGFSREEIDIRSAEMEADYGEIRDQSRRIQSEIRKRFELVLKNIDRPYEEAVAEFVSFVCNHHGRE